MLEIILLFLNKVTFDAAWSPDCVDGRCYDYKAIADAVDFMVIMAYDQQSQIKEGPCIAKANSPYEQTIKGISFDVEILIDPIYM